MNKFVPCVPIVALTLLVGCYLPDDNSVYPGGYEKEILVNGATLAVSFDSLHGLREFTENYISFPVEGIPRAVIQISAEFIFAPYEERETVDFQNTLPCNYTLSYSILSGEKAYFKVAELSEFIAPEIQCELKNNAKDFITNGNHYIDFSWPVIIPLEATHVELWIDEGDQNDSRLVRRFALNSFLEYNETILPFIKESSPY